MPTIAFARNWKNDLAKHRSSRCWQMQSSATSSFPICHPIGAQSESNRLGRPFDDAKKVLPGLGRLVFRLASIAKVQAISLIAGGTIVSALLWNIDQQKIPHSLNINRQIMNCFRGTQIERGAPKSRDISDHFDVISCPYCASSKVS